MPDCVALRLADLVVRVCMHPNGLPADKLASYKPWLVPPHGAEASIEIKWSDVGAGQDGRYAVKDAREAGLSEGAAILERTMDWGKARYAVKFFSFSPEIDGERLLAQGIAMTLLAHGRLMIHAAAIERQGAGYLFFGPSGAGKTTVARVSRDCRVLNDDLVIIGQDGTQQWWVFSTPFTHPKQVAPSGLARAPLRGVFRLVQSKEVRVAPLHSVAALSHLLPQVPILPRDTVCIERVWDQLCALVNSYQVYDLYFLPDASFWRVIDDLQ